MGLSFTYQPPSGGLPEASRYAGGDSLLLGDGTPKKVSLELPSPKAGIETISLGKNVIYWSVSKENLTKTSYMKLTKLQVYQEVTIRNHNTVFKLLQLFDKI